MGHVTRLWFGLFHSKSSVKIGLYRKVVSSVRVYSHREKVETKTNFKVSSGPAFMKIVLHASLYTCCRPDRGYEAV